MSMKLSEISRVIYHGTSPTKTKQSVHQIKELTKCSKIIFFFCSKCPKFIFFLLQSAPKSYFFCSERAPKPNLALASLPLQFLGLTHSFFPLFYQIAFVEDLANGEGFESFLKSDKNFRALHSYAPVAEVAENHCMEVSDVFNNWHDKGREYFEQMQREKTEFFEKVKEVQEFSFALFKEEFQCYINLKEEIPKELCVIYHKRISSEQKDLLIQNLKEKYIKEIKSTHANLMNASCFCIDLVHKLERTFETEILQITDNYLQEVQGFYENIMKIDETYISQLKSFYDNIFDTGFNSDLEFSCQAKAELQLKSIFSKLLRKKAYVEMALKMSISIHSTLLQERIKKLESSLENFKIDTKDQFLKSVFAKQNELTRDIVIFCSKQMYIIDKIFSDSDHFQQYLGYT